MHDYQEGQPIRPGFAWRLRIEFEPGGVPVFPDGCRLVGHVRLNEGGELLAELSTDNERIFRVDDFAVDIFLPPDATAGWRHRSVKFDLARVDLDPPEYLGIRVEVPVEQTITRL